MLIKIGETVDPAGVAYCKSARMEDRGADALGLVEPNLSNAPPIEPMEGPIPPARGGR